MRKNFSFGSAGGYIDTIPLPLSVLVLSRVGPTVKKYSLGGDKNENEIEVSEDSEQLQG
jgi:hypothetical protein